jgi:inorganic pyrophosphatase
VTATASISVILLTILPGAMLAVRPVGVLLMEDEHGPDEKIIGVPVSRLTRRYDHVLELEHLPEIGRQQVEHFFAHYKQGSSQNLPQIVR